MKANRIKIKIITGLKKRMKFLIIKEHKLIFFRILINLIKIIMIVNITIDNIYNKTTVDIEINKTNNNMMIDIKINNNNNVLIDINKIKIIIIKIMNK